MSLVFHIEIEIINGNISDILSLINILENLKILN